MATSRRIITCTACGRTGPHHARGWCDTCYDRWTRHGCPASGPPAPVPCGRLGAEACDVDPLIVEHAVAGYQPPLNAGERRAAIAELRARRLIARAIADRLGCATRTVERHLAALKTAATTEGNRS